MEKSGVKIAAQNRKAFLHTPPPDHSSKAKVSPMPREKALR